MTLDSCYELGLITKPHGLKGELQLFLDVDHPEEYTNLESVFVEQNKQLVPFFIETLFVKGAKKIVARFEDVTTLEEAETLRGAKLYLPLAALPKLEKGQFYFHDVIGHTVIDATAGEIGTVITFNNASAQTIMVVEFNHKEILIPVTDQILKSSDSDKKQIHVTLPEGLLDIYLDEDQS